MNSRKRTGKTRPKRLQSTHQLTKLMQRHYLKARLVRFLKPVAWVTSGAPVEILRAMGIEAVYPENYGALCGARGAGTTLSESAEARGYAPELCSYAKISLGSIYDPAKAPMKGLPKPDVLIVCNNICNTVVKWFEAVAAHYRIPIFILDTPFLHDGLEEHTVAYVKSQLEELIAFLERTTRRRFKERRLREVIELSDECVRLWGEIRQMCKARPSPLNAPDLFVNMAAIVVLRGTREAVDYYRMLRDEVKQRVEQGIGAVPGERFRLLWDNIALWNRLYRFYTYFARKGCCFVVDTYTGAWDAPIEEGEPLEALARTYTGVFLNRSLRYRAELIARLIREYEVDGFVMHSNRSCKPYSLGQYDIRRIVSEWTGVPGLVIEADMCDSRYYSEQQLRTRIDAFVEQLEG